MSQGMTDLDVQGAAYLERLLAEFLRDPDSVSPEWQRYFQQYDSSHVNGTARLGTSLGGASVFNPASSQSRPERPWDAARLQDRVNQLVHAYRVRGHLIANLDPLGFIQRTPPPELELSYYGFSEADRERTFSTPTVGGPDAQPLQEIVERLQATYCRSIGVQFMHIDDLEIRQWLADRMERTQNRLELSHCEQLRILRRLTDAVVFEEFVRKKYVGAKSFSLEGAESLVPLLDLAIEKAAAQGVDEIVMAMAHRGRLNVLANIIGKAPQEIFEEFEDAEPNQQTGSGDVKYHLGYSGDWSAANGRRVHLSLCFNPSHLEFVNPVALGRLRAKQDRARNAVDRHRSNGRPSSSGMTLLIHGDASFAGEGIIQESLNLSELPGFSVGGTLHVVVNNQIGFTTTPAEGRSTHYATDVARMLQIPIFHVNGEDPEAVAAVITLALDFRERYRRDVVVDLYCFRRWGHNEGDEPSFTQPLMSQAIAHRESVRDRYVQHMLESGVVTRAEVDRIAEERHAVLQQEFDQLHVKPGRPARPVPQGIWDGYVGGPEPTDEPFTGVPADQLSQLLERLTETPVGFHLHRKLQRSVERRRGMAEGTEPLDWAAAEALAFASLAVEGYRVRLTGQDSERGTFSQRHAVLHDVVNGSRYEIFQHLTDDQASVEIVNSPLCEAATMGFEYGYSLDYPEALVAWEGQFGDFVNAGQVIIDQFIASAEDKWRRLSGLVLLLPHGWEGQGPEHSSARLERFLTLAAEHNFQVVSPSTPAQYFHVLRRQMLRTWRKPLIVLTPKSLLRHPQAVSPLADFSSGRFQRVIPDTREKSVETKRVLLCSGKLYYELLKAREDQGRRDLAIVCVEQFYPLPEEPLHEAFAVYPEGLPVWWVQEEPENMGAWGFWRRHYCPRFLNRFPLLCVARPESASPATGSAAAHRREQRELIERALEPA